MARPLSSSGKSEVFLKLDAEATSMNERNDCAVKALAIVCEIPYKVAHDTLSLLGRKSRHGTQMSYTEQAVELNGCKMELVDPQHFIAKYPGAHKGLKSVTTHHMERFPEAWADGETYLIRTSGHILAVVNGQNMDCTKGRAMRAKAIYRITKND